MHTITQIAKARKGSKRYHIFVDGQKFLSVHEDVLVKFNLYKGMVVKPEQLVEWTRADELAKVRRAVYRYLGYRARSVHEVRTYLAQQGWDAAICEEVIQECVQQGYLNDQTFAKTWVEERGKQKGFGKLRLKHELARKGIAADDIETALQHIDEEEERQKAFELAERRYLRIQALPWPTIERRIGQYLLHKGYSTEIAYSVLAELRTQKKDEEL